MVSPQSSSLSRTPAAQSMATAICEELVDTPLDEFIMADDTESDDTESSASELTEKDWWITWDPENPKATRALPPVVKTLEGFLQKYKEATNALKKALFWGTTAAVKVGGPQDEQVADVCAFDTMIDAGHKRTRKILDDRVRYLVKHVQSVYKLHLEVQFDNGDNLWEEKVALSLTEGECSTPRSSARCPPAPSHNASPESAANVQTPKGSHSMIADPTGSLFPHEDADAPHRLVQLQEQAEVAPFNGTPVKRLCREASCASVGDATGVTHA